jgi:hypothetical protein
MVRHQVHLVGGVPLSSAGDVFETASRILGPALSRIPDGEVGRPWMGWFSPVITENSFLEKTNEEFRPHAGGYATFRYRLKSGVQAREVVFSRLRHAEIAIESYRIFSRLKAQGKVAAEAKYLCTLAHPIPIIRRYFSDDLQGLLEPAFERALTAEVEKIVDAIPHEELAIQWDCASAIFATLQLGKPNRFGPTRDAMHAELAQRLARFGAIVPADVDLLYHFCYGNSNGKHSVEPSSTRDAVMMANRVRSLLRRERPVQLIHLPVPIDRDDEGYFEPLADLDHHPDGALALGLVHPRDGVEGTRRRMDMARRYLPSFAIATECGLSHIPRDSVIAVLKLQAEIAGVSN